MQAQNEDGSWGQGQAEPTAYAILTLADLVSLPASTALRMEVIAAIDKGRNFLTRVTEADYVWIEKVTFRSRNFHRAYVLAALNAPLANQKFNGKVGKLTKLPWQKIEKLQKFSARIPLLASLQDWKVKAALIEGFMFLPQLRESQPAIFSERDPSDKKYIEYIPFAWTATNILGQAHLRAEFLQEMMIISVLNYQADEYMEGSVRHCFASRLGEAKCLIQRLFSDHETEGSSAAPRPSIEDPNSEPHGAESLSATDTMSGTDAGSLRDVSDISTDINADRLSRTNHRITEVDVEEIEVAKTLQRFIKHVLSHPKVELASQYDKIHLRRELQKFLLAHVDQIEDSCRLSQGEMGFSTPERSFFDWVRRTGSDNTSCPYSFAFAQCLLGDGKDFFDSSAQKYYAQVACQHLATLCRMYNDIGSLARDREESNLNSLNFPEFLGDGKMKEEGGLKADLYQLTLHERKCLDMAVESLKGTSTMLMRRLLPTFVDVTDLFGQIYMEKDIGIRTR
ncbi:MAG: hypothetical protein Q9219_004974 [cf. Caloplaca sp. 3 TL-2023]